MQRFNITPRPDWRAKVESVGLAYHTIEGETYWDESLCYHFTLPEIEELERAGNECQRLYIEATERAIREERFQDLRIPQPFVDLLVQSWERDDPTMYGRFDFSYSGEGSGPPKLMEYNADTPTSLLESSVVQWYWMKDVLPDADQFNSIHERLLAFWKKPALPHFIHFSCLPDSAEDLGNTEYIRDVATQAGHGTDFLYMEDIGLTERSHRFVGLANEPIEALFKLYPWEHMLSDEFAPHIASNQTLFIEPPWKLFWSNKAMLCLLWEYFPDHPNLLPAFFDDRLRGDRVRKPIFSREGSNVEIRRGNTITRQPGLYGTEGWIYQSYHALPAFGPGGEYRAVCGVWNVEGEACGLGIREDGDITTDHARYIPHYFSEDDRGPYTYGR